MNLIGLITHFLVKPQDLIENHTMRLFVFFAYLQGIGILMNFHWMKRKSVCFRLVLLLIGDWIGLECTIEIILLKCFEYFVPY